MGLAQSSIAANTYAQVQVSANYLAGEAIEYVRNIRDTNFIQNNADWLAHIPAQCYTTTGCDVDTVNPTVNEGFTAPNACVSGCPALQFSTTNGYYQHQTGAYSAFTRTVYITKITNNGVQNEIQVRVTITSNSGYFKQAPLAVVEHMFDLRKTP